MGRSGPGSPYFAPTLLEGIAGESIRVHIVNATPVLHNFSIAAEAVNVDVPPGGVADLIATFPTRGALVYICRFHASDGQAGELLTLSP